MEWLTTGPEKVKEIFKLSNSHFGTSITTTDIKRRWPQEWKTLRRTSYLKKTSKKHLIKHVDYKYRKLFKPNEKILE